MRFYNKLPDMECLSGDTLPAFHVKVEGAELSKLSMQVILADSRSPNVAVLSKECTAASGGFAVQLTSEDTSRLTEGTYIIHFRLDDQNGLSMRKLVGELYVHSVPIGKEDYNGADV